MSVLSDISNALAAAGVNASTITSAVAGVASVIHPTSSIKTKLQQVAAISSDPQAVQALVTQIETDANFPASAIPLMQMLKTPGLSQTQIIQFVLQIEQAIS